MPCVETVIYNLEGECFYKSNSRFSKDQKRHFRYFKIYDNPVLSPSLPHLQGAMFLPWKYFGSPSVVFPDRMHTGQLPSFLGESPAIFTNKLKSQNGDSER